jgi:hypothetical protein
MVQKTVISLHTDGFVVPLRHNVAFDVEESTHVPEQRTELPSFINHHYHAQSYLQ